VNEEIDTTEEDEEYDCLITGDCPEEETGNNGEEQEEEPAEENNTSGDPDEVNTNNFIRKFIVA
jgi:hypothetical protein